VRKTAEGALQAAAGTDPDRPFAPRHHQDWLRWAVDKAPIGVIG
jgi:hypothetical protein